MKSVTFVYNLNEHSMREVLYSLREDEKRHDRIHTRDLWQSKLLFHVYS